MAHIATILENEVGKTYVSDWMSVDQKMIDSFADVTHDWNFIHTDPEKAAQTPYGGTIAHGFLLLSLLAPLRGASSRPAVPGLRMGVNYGLEKVRFVSAVRSGSRIRGVFTIVSMTEKSAGQFLEDMDVLVEIEGKDRPAVAARWLTMYFA